VLVENIIHKGQKRGKKHTGNCIYTLYPVCLVIVDISNYVISGVILYKMWGECGGVWLRHCASSQVAGSIPDGVRILH
jgi:hypothetical protein